MSSNSQNLFHALDYLQQVIEARASMYFNDNGKKSVSLPDLAFYDDGSAFAHFIEEREPNFYEYVILLLALAPHIRPNFLEKTIQQHLPANGDFAEIGGLRNGESRVFSPTGETALFLLAGDDLHQRFEVQRILSSEHWLVKEGILELEPVKPGEPYFSGRLMLNPEYIELFTLGQISSPPFSSSFPAREITTQLDWEDLILSPSVLEQIEELKRWVEYHETLMGDWGMGAKIKPGYRALFYGPPGTGKTLTATLLGKYTDRSVYRIDLSTVVSKYIGETEKNLAQLFDRARNRDWILFFDEADALFGKRTNVKDAHDRYANQEVSYLLQRVEDFNGLVILASNFKANIDEAFLRRFNAIIKFPFPAEEEREAIWRISMPQDVSYADGIDLPALMRKFELTGGNIVNVVQHTCIEAIARGGRTIRLEDALKGVRREVEKEGKVFKNLLEEQTA